MGKFIGSQRAIRPGDTTVDTLSGDFPGRQDHRFLLQRGHFPCAC